MKIERLIKNLKHSTRIIYRSEKILYVLSYEKNTQSLLKYPSNNTVSTQQLYKHNASQKINIRDVEVERYTIDGKKDLSFRAIR